MAGFPQDLSNRIQEFTAEELLGPLNDVERKNAPKRLFLLGDVGLVRSGSRVSIVGSRKASAEGLARAGSLARALVRHGVTVVSGLAEGIDTAAHEATIAEGGRTIAVLGTSLGECSPAKNRALQEQLGRDHLVVSQFPLGHHALRENFPMRNRTMALLSEVTVIVEAGQKSGTLHQGWEALRLGRLLFLMESVVRDSKLTWPAEIISYGAQVLSRDNLELFLNGVPLGSRAESIAF